MAKRKKRSRQFPDHAPRRPTNTTNSGSTSSTQEEAKAHVFSSKSKQVGPDNATEAPQSIHEALATPLFDSLAIQPDQGEKAHVSEGPEQKQALRVPMEYRAQVDGRCQRQFIRKPENPPPDWKSDAQRWVGEWIERVDGHNPFPEDNSVDGLRLFKVDIDWRMISNSGVDEGFIRPVIGAGGWPMIPGSGIKGVFRRACSPDRLQRWCGSPFGAGVLRQGILRFHGAWPVDRSWSVGLLDLAHPQQNWQVGFTGPKARDHSAFAVASLYMPRLQIAISTTSPSLQKEEWHEIEGTLKRALQLGLGGRTCAGYGRSGCQNESLIFQCELEGQAPAPKLLDNTSEFRPTMFRAAIRGMALRLFGGLTDSSTAQQMVGQLFGSISREEGHHVGLLSMAYEELSGELGIHGKGRWQQPIFTTKGNLQWNLTRQFQDPKIEALLTDLLAALHGLTMSLGGFGRSWRRPDHRIFFPEYYNQGKQKAAIGCHWEWRNTESLPEFILVKTSADLIALLHKSRVLASQWLQIKGASHSGSASWREVIEPERMLIWTRSAEDTNDGAALRWFHMPKDGDPPGSPLGLRRSDLAGSLKKVGCIWNRLLPLETGGLGRKLARNHSAQPRAAATARPSRPGQKPSPGGEVWMNYSSGPFLESVVLFPKECQSEAFIRAMNNGAGEQFERLKW